MLAPILACLMFCGEQVVVQVDAEAAPAARRDVRYVLAPADPVVKPGNPDYIALSRAAARVLDSQGFRPAASAAEADVTVLLDWMVGDPRMVVRHAGGDAGQPAVRGAAEGGRGGMPVGGTNNSASFGFGMEASDRGELVYARTVTLKAVAPAASGEAAASAEWRMTLRSEGGTDQVPVFAPQMLAAAMPYVARSAARVRVRLGAAEAPVKFVRGEIATLPDRN